MRKDGLNILAKVSKKLHLQHFAYNLCKVLVPLHECKEVVAPEEYLHKVFPEKRNSCICNNHISLQPQYDLQVIVPVYNVENYIRECVESLIHQQTKYSYHVIIVNDGSTDKSRIILEQYAQIPNITIIDKPNGGLSSARNIALRNIDARYVMFVDSDDYISHDAIERLVSKADESNADIVEGNHRYFLKNKTLKISSHIEAEGVNLPLHGVAWGKVYKADLWQHVSFPEGYWFEDIINPLFIYALPLREVTIPNIVYHYRATPTSITLGNNNSLRRVETYWVTKQVLHDAFSEQVPVTQLYYNTFLHQCHVNTSRVAILGDRKADYALYKAHQLLRNTYFKDYRTQEQKEKRIESALLNNDFKEYFLYCLFLY